VAATKVNYQEVFTDTFGPATESGGFDISKAGFVGGGGVSYQLPMEHWSVKGEYLYTDFGRTTIASNNLLAFEPPVSVPQNVFTHSMALHAHIIRAGINYRW
jgi:opacity protein-like surface antigen